LAEAHEKFSESAIRALQTAEEEAQALDQTAVGVEHLLLGVLQDRGSVATLVLGRLGVDLDALDEATRAIAGRSADLISGPAAFGPYARDSIEHAADEALASGAALVAPEHLLLGVLRSESPTLVPVLRGRGLTAERVRRAVARLAGRSQFPASR
jgi:ATP-dependent Clp protease ATP-binding subunit ClpC